ncbi:MAG: hypothetical protein KDK51_10415, partial [Deltaproteobacteria bacterium]|nr:hypothetical protein [Deltaproteobacteria bacterium]
YTNFLEDIPETTRQNFPQVSSQTLLADGMFEIHKRMRKIQENSDQANITAYQLIDPKPSYTFIISPKRYLFKNDQYIQPAKSQEGLIGKTMASYPNATVIAIELCDQDCAFDANDKHSIMKEIASPVPNAPHKKQYIKIKPLELAKFFKNNVHFQN